MTRRDSRHEPTRPKGATRPKRCLRCEAWFESYGPGHRQCGRCRKDSGPGIKVVSDTRGL